ncbi:hypothetical protein C8J57DRAFT_1505975 [Mycena rebaudengoi]|nr:hypothetical protein C8J57DRAFT_1505975 [Mycena rebaudengoi]
MSSHIETPKHTWLVEELPAHLRFLDALDLPGPDEPVENYEVVPRTYHSKLEWAHIGYNPHSQDHTRQVLLVYKHPRILPHAPPNMLYPVGIRVQAFIRSCILVPLGTWTGGDDPPQKALQFVILGGAGVIDEQFANLRVPVPHGNWAESELLYIARRVFTKITAKNRHLTCALFPGEDPTNTAAQVQAHWRVLDRLSAGMYVPDEADATEGFKVPCNPMTFGSGDFVDVCIGFDIVSRGDGKNRTTHQVHLKLEHILLLAAANDLPQPAEEPSVTEMHVQSAGLVF